MIDFELAKRAFKDYLKDFNEEEEKVAVKIVHTYKVVEFAEYIAKELNLDEEDIELAKLIALLHDIGRFEQVSKYDDFRDSITLDHAELGVKILFDYELIRNFIKDTKYDSIIYQAVLNHNKLSIPEGLNEKEMLHSKIIRDADKLDMFRGQDERKITSYLYLWDMEEIENSTITEKIFQDFMNSKCIKNEERITAIDYWISYTAFLFDLNFNVSIKHVKEKNYINKNIDKINYKNPETKEKMELIRKHALDFVESKLK